MTRDAKQPAPTPRTDWMLAGLLALSLLGNVVLALRPVQSMQAAGEDLPQAPAVGDVFPAFSGATIAGATASVSFAGYDKTLIYFWSPSCIWCERNAPNIKALVENARSKYRIVGLVGRRVSGDQVLAMGLNPSDVVMQVPPAVLHQLHLRSTPQTVLVDSTGEVTNVWSGAYTRGNQKTLERVFGISLPGLQADGGRE